MISFICRARKHVGNAAANNRSDDAEHDRPENRYRTRLTCSTSGFNVATRTQFLPARFASYNISSAFRTSALKSFRSPLSLPATPNEAVGLTLCPTKGNERAENTS